MTQPQSTTDDRRTGPLIQAYGEDGTLAGYVAQGVIVLNPDGSIPATAPVSDATAANQVLQIAQETAINTVLGTTADAAVAAGAAGTNSAKMRRLTTDVAAINTTLGTPFQAGGVIGALPAGSAIIGKVGIDQTTPGTTNLVSAAQSGTWTVQPGNTANTTAWKVDGSAVTQPVSSATLATAANQATMITNQTATGASAQSVQGSFVNLSTSAPNPFLQAARFMTTRPTYTNGQLGEVQMDARGGVYAALASGANVVTITSLAGDGFSTGNVGLVTRSEGMTSNGTTLDITRKPNVVKRIASSAASGNPDFLKASAGELSQFWGTCGVTAAFLQVYNKASAPTVGSDTPILTYPIPAAANFTQTIPNGGLYFSTGVAFAFTTDAAATTGSAAAAITACMLIGM